MFPRTTFYLALNACLNLAATASQLSSGSTKYSENAEKVAISWTDASTVLGRPDTYLGKLAVPLDYTLPQSKSKTLTLNILKVKATKEPKLGSVLTNWGGPGLPATDWLLQQARYVLALVVPYPVNAAMTC